MPRRTTRSRRPSRLTSAMTIEDLNAMVLTDPDELAAIYGSLDFARQRYDHLVETGQERRRPGMLPPGVWWLTEPGVPHELRSLMNFPGGGPDDEMWDSAVIDALEVARWRWFAETGYVTDADRDDITRLADRSAYYTNAAEIAAVIG